MADEIVVFLDGSSRAETILPLAQALAAGRGDELSVLKVVRDTDELSSEEAYLRTIARRFGAQMKFLLSEDPAAGLLAELEKNPRAIPAMTTHGRTSWSEAIMGSVALRVISGARRPVILHCPLAKHGEPPAKIGMLVTALDGNDFSEKIIPFAAGMAKSIKARLVLVQALPLHPAIPSAAPQDKTDVLESSYLQGKARAIKSTYSIECEWEVLYGQPAEAICRHVSAMRETMLAMTTHAHGGIKRVVMGRVAGTCVRRTGIPMLVYWPEQRN